jgi:hypothetical protein
VATVQKPRLRQPVSIHYLSRREPSRFAQVVRGKRVG